MADIRKVGRRVTLRIAGKNRPAKITAVGAGTTVDVKVISSTQTAAGVSKQTGNLATAWTRSG